PIGALRIAVGGLLLVFGLQWMRKAVLRASGRKPLHDEAAIFERQVATARGQVGRRRGVVRDWYGFTLAFKGVLLEGLEVVFIVLTFGANAQNIPVASAAAVAAVVVVVILGVLVRGPLSRVPENTLKFVVGIMLTAFGLYWGAEGAGAVWPGSDAALLLIVPGMLVFALALVALFRPRSPSAPSSTLAPPAGDPRPATATPAAAGSSAVATAVRPQVRPPAVAALRAFGAFWVDFLFGDDWQVAALVAVGIAGTACVAIAAPAAAWIVLAAVVLGTLPYSAVRALR
ncbi:hypothetical protein, partial [Amnibacterium sp.]|uniref:hypothetical protein n=1 Tax=Amnibacterium sp. TaxID=1872496 RepID=UPI00260992B8